MNTGDMTDVTLWVWWTAACGYLHTETNPVYIDFRCDFHEKSDA